MCGIVCTYCSDHGAIGYSPASRYPFIPIILIGVSRGSGPLLVGELDKSRIITSFKLRFKESDRFQVARI